MTRWGPIRPFLILGGLLIQASPLPAQTGRLADRSLVLPDSMRTLVLPDSVRTLALPDSAEERVFLERFPDEWAADSSSVRFEVGASTDLTNEQFYEDAYSDTIFHTRRLVSTPEARVAGVLFTSLDGTRGGRAVQYQLQNQLSLGDKLQQEAASLSWRHDLAPEWRYLLFPRFEYRHDRTFGRDLEEWRGSAGSRLRKSFADRTLFAELGGHGEILRSDGRGSDLLLDRQAGQVALSLDRVPLVGSEWRLGYRLALRGFPDSLSRDHWEHGLEARWKHVFGRGHSLLLEMDGERRVTREIAPTSRDNFWQGAAAIEGEARWWESGGVRTRLAVEGVRYDVEDDLLFFDYQVARGRLGPRWERGPLTLAVESRGEALFAPRNTAEEYRDVGGAVEIELLGSKTWWTITPAAGWRDYGEATPVDTLDLASLHSSFAFYELGLIADQAIPGGMRLRLFADARHESHIDAAQNARSLYFSLDVRRLF